MKRAGIYFFYDQSGIVDRYVLYSIRELKKVVDYIVVVINGVLKPESRRELASVADDMFVRENKGFDAWAYKDGIDYIGWDELGKYDELILTNFTMFGPVYPYEELFNRMATDPCDFWGLYLSYENQKVHSWGSIPLKWNYKPDALATSFLAFRANVLKSVEFIKHWETLPEINNYYESGVYNEMQLTQMLKDAGFTMSVVCPDSFRYDYQNPTVDGALEAIIDCRIPLLRRKVFFDQNGSLDYATDTPRKLLYYLSTNTDYDVDMIWENLIRTTNLNDLSKWLNLNTILPLDAFPAEESKDKIAVIFHCEIPKHTADRVKYLESFSEKTDFYFTVAEDKLKELQSLLAPFEAAHSVIYRTAENGLDEIGTLLTTCGDLVLSSDYELICFLHDRALNEEEASMLSVERTFSEACYENVAAGEAYVRSLIELFRRHPRLGIAVPPPPRNAQYYRLIGGSWNGSFRGVTKLLEDLELKVPIAANRPPTAPFGHIFWFRAAALAPLFRRKWLPEDFAPETTSGYENTVNTVTAATVFVAQSSGYFPMVVMNDRYAEQELTVLTDIAHTYVEMTIKYVRARSSIGVATRLFKQHENNITKEKGGSRNNQKVRVKRLVKGVCPIGLWELSRKIRCAIKGEQYISDDQARRNPLKTAVRLCMPRGLWEYLKARK